MYDIYMNWHTQAYTEILPHVRNGHHRHILHVSHNQGKTFVPFGNPAASLSIAPGFHIVHMGKTVGFESYIQNV